MKMNFDMYSAYSGFEELVGRDTALNLIGLKKGEGFAQKHVPMMLEVMRCHIIVEQRILGDRGLTKGKRTVALLKPVCWCCLANTPYMNGLEYYACYGKGPLAAGQGRDNLQKALAEIIKLDKGVNGDKRLQLADKFMNTYRTTYPTLEIVLDRLGILEPCNGVIDSFERFLDNV